MKKFLSLLSMFLLMIALGATSINALPDGWEPPEDDNPITEVPIASEPYGPTYVGYAIQNSLVQWKPFMSDYNCYGYAIGVNDWILPGYSYNSEWNAITTVSQTTSKVMNDLVNLGYANVRTVNAYYTPSDDEYLIAFRTGEIVYFTFGDDTEKLTDIHFMKYDVSTDAWTQKPGGTAVIQLLDNSDITGTWLVEQYRVYTDGTQSGWYRADLSKYAGILTFIAYRDYQDGDPIQVMY